MMESSLRVVDLFSGGGGLSLGFQNAGFEIAAAFDHWKQAVELYKINITGHPVYQADLSDPGILKTIQSFQPDMIMGGPPCQDFSSAGSRDETKGRANLTIVFADIVTTILPRYFVMENVERARKSNAFATAKDIFESHGYKLSSMVLDASLCGVPQKRKRFIVYGELGGTTNQLLPYIIRNQSSTPMTLRDFFGKKLGFEHYYRHPRSYKRRGVFSIDEPSPTVRGVNRPIPNGYPGHPGDTACAKSGIRPLTTKERSLIQTFPETYILEGTKTDLEQIIGNAVPVKLAEFVGTAIQELISDQLNNRYPLSPCTEIEQLVLFEQKAAYKTSPLSSALSN
jgi:DNA (cytosine-5)-methyltransferase 1